MEIPQSVESLIWAFGLFAVIGVPLFFYSLWRWSKTCDENIEILKAETGGGGKFELAPKEGGSVTITNTQDGTAKEWPINELATIGVPYPGIGGLPKFLQKEIRLAILNEGDWEPMLNRSPHRENIASPDVVEFLLDVAKESDPTVKARIEALVANLATGPTREMIANPSVLGNLMQSSIMKALATVTNDLMDVMKSLNTRLGRVGGGLNPTAIYVGFGLILVVLIVMLFQVLPLADSVASQGDDIIRIKQALGVTGG